MWLWLYDLFHNHPAIGLPTEKEAIANESYTLFVDNNLYMYIVYIQKRIIKSISRWTFSFYLQAFPVHARYLSILLLTFNYRTADQSLL